MLEILISSSVLIMVLAILRLILRDKISARLQYALWFLVLVRLLVPVSFFHSPVSVAEAAAPAVTRVEALSDTAVSYRYIFRGTGASVEPGEIGTFEQTSAVPLRTVRDAARYIWYGGMGVMAAWFLLVNIRLARRLRQNRTPYDYNSVMPVYVAEGIPSPCLFGQFKPSIYLTERAAEDDAQARQIIAHELTHYRHGDMIWSLMRSVCLVVWWFNPLVWLAAALSRQDCELACDEGTIKALGEETRFDYGRTLVGMAKVGSRPSDLLCGATTMTTGKKSLKDRVARIANAPKMSVTVAVIVLIIAAIAVGCTYGSAELPEQEIAFEPAAGSASATDAEDLPAAYSVTIRDPDSGDVLTETPADDGELRELYAVYSALKTLARPLETSDVFSDAEMSYDVRFYDDDTYIGFRMWEDGTFLLFDVKFGGSPTGVYVSPELAERFLDILDEYHSESAEAVFVSDEIIGTYNRDYWEEVDRELASFAVSGDAEVFISPYMEFDETLPADDISGQLTLEDYVYGTDGWKFTYNSETIANDPAAAIIVHDADGRTLWIMDDADALMIEEADGSITWVDYGANKVDCADMIRHLLSWARGEYPVETPAPPVDEAQQERTEQLLAELGLYTLTGRERTSVDGSTDYYNELPNRPLWAKLITMEYPDYVDLVYSRWWSDEDLSVPANEEFFTNIQNSIAEVYLQTTGLSVNGHEAFLYTDTIGFTSIVWLDEQADLVFQLYKPILHGETAATDDELIAMAESISAQ